MEQDEFAAALESLISERAEEVERGVERLREWLPALPEVEFHRAVEGLCELFYVDTHDRPDLAPSLELAVQALAAAGERVVPRLLDSMRGSDIKSHTFLARALGLVGRPALPALRRFVVTEEDAYSRAFALYALGKIRDPEIREAIPEMVAALVHPDKEVRDSAARALGKVTDVVPADALTEGRRTEIFEALFRVLGDFQPAVRAKAIRSLGKMVRAGYLTRAQEERVGGAARSILGQDEAYNWDRAYIVRRQAEEALRHVVARQGRPAP